MNMIDSFAELIAYTLYFIENLKFTQAPYKETIEKFTQLIIASRESVVHDEILADWEKSLLAVCAWIDEQISLSNWQEKEVWQLSPLQKQYFRTTHAGENFFEVLDHFDQVEDSHIIEVYNFCVKLGFQGKNFQPTSKNQQLVESINNLNRPLINYIDSGVTTIFSRAYRSDQITKKKIKGRKIRLTLNLVLFLTITVSVLSIVLLHEVYSFLLYEQVLRSF